MERIKRYLLPDTAGPMLTSSLLLAMRLIFGFLFLNHGISKWIAFESLALSFPDPLGIGSTVSLLLCMFAEIICSIGFILGAAYRLSLVPMIIAMAVALFSVHSGAPITTKEPALIYLCIFCIMFLWGPGYFSIDSLLIRTNSKKRL